MRHSVRFSSLRSSSVILRFLAPSVFLAAVLLTGCGGGAKDVVSGTVKTKKDKLINGQIIFKSSDGKEVSGAILDGKYKVEGVPKGELDVIIKGTAGGSAPVPPPKDASKDMPSASGGGVAPNKKYESAGALPKFKFDGGKKENADFVLDD